jgi:hypothetical protein
MGRICPKMLGFNGRKRAARIRFDREVRELKAERIDGKPAMFRVHGFAAAFETGTRVWPAVVTFVETAP